MSVPRPIGDVAAAAGEDRVVTTAAKEKLGAVGAPTCDHLPEVPWTSSRERRGVCEVRTLCAGGINPFSDPKAPCTSVAPGSYSKMNCNDFVVAEAPIRPKDRLALGVCERVHPLAHDGHSEMVAMRLMVGWRQPRTVA